MNEQTLQALRELADKLGTTTEYLWGVLIAQAQIDAWLFVMWACVLLLPLGPMWWKIYRVAAKKDTSYDGRYYSEGSREDAATLGAILTIIAGATGLFCVHNAVIAFSNPEFWALKQILP